MQLADYAMISNAVPQDVRLKSPNELQAERLQLSDLALGNQQKQIQTQMMQETESDPFSEHAKKVAKADADNKFVINALGASINEPDPVKKNQIWQSGLKYLQDNGHDVTSLPQQYDDAEARRMLVQSIGVQKDLDNHNAELKMEIERMRAESSGRQGSGGSEYHVPLSTANGAYSFNARTGTIEQLTDAGGVPVVKAADDPGLQRKLAEAKTSGKNEADRANKAMGSESTLGQQFNNIDEARKLLKVATGSLLGAGRDVAAGAFGVATEGKKAAAQLETIGGWMQLNVPRFEGPQSDRDVQVYQKMAARVADATEPTESRLAALDTLERMTRQASDRAKKVISQSGEQITSTSQPAEPASQRLEHVSKSGNKITFEVQ